MEIKQVNFAEKNFVKEVTKKTQIVVHHTVSGDGIDGDVAWWNKSTDKIAAHYIIDRQGVINQLFDDKYWAYHLGTSTAHYQKFGLSYQNLNRSSIGIELDSWGPVTAHGDKFYPVRWDATSRKYLADTSKKPISNYPEEYCTGFRGHKYYERYTPLQLSSLSALLDKLCLEHGIPPKYKGDSFWIANKIALAGQSGIWGHCSFRADKTDPHPQAELVNLLKGMS